MSKDTSCFGTYKMETVKQINIKNQTYYFYNVIIDLESFKSNLLKIDKKSCKNVDIYNIGYNIIKKIDDCENINSVNNLYLCITYAIRYIEEINESKYLIFDSTDENKEGFKRYNDVFKGIRDEIKTINAGKENYYEKDYMKIKFNSDDNLTLNKPLKFHLMNIIIRSVFEKDGKFF